MRAHMPSIMESLHAWMAGLAACMHAWLCMQGLVGTITRYGDALLDGLGRLLDLASAYTLRAVNLDVKRFACCTVQARSACCGACARRRRRGAPCMVAAALSFHT